MNDDRHFSAIIDAIGVATLAKLLGLEESHIRVMKARDSIPPEYWGPIIAIAANHNIAALSHEKMRVWRAGRFRRGRSAISDSAEAQP